MTSRAVVLLLLVAFAAAGLAPDARAAFPGKNGKIAFTSFRDGNHEIYVMNADGSDEQRRTTNTATDSHPAFSADGQLIAFASDRDDPGQRNQIYVMNADGTDPQRRTTAFSDAQPAFSPDGQRIAFRSVRDGVAQIYVMDADGTDAQPLADTVGGEDPVFSPDGTKIAFWRSDAFFSVYVTNADGTGTATSVTDDGPAGAERSPVYSPDGTKIAFVAVVQDPSSGNFFRDVLVMNADGTGTPDNLTNSSNPSSSDEEPAFSPDGTKIAFLSDRAGEDQMHVMNANGTDQQRRATDSIFIGGPDWQPVPNTRVAIRSGPSGVVASRVAEFAFDLVADDPGLLGEFECRLDAEVEFFFCAESVTFPDLAEGEHTLDVRFDPEDGPPTAATSRSWVVDTVAPSVTFSEQPPVESTSPNATFAWDASEASSFLCSLDDGPLEGCASPRSVVGLADGPHSFRVQAIDAVGNEGDVATVTWSVDGICPAGDAKTTNPGCLAPVATGCPSGTKTRSPHGVFQVVARGGPASCFATKRIGGNEVDFSTGLVSLNGIEILPVRGGEVQVGTVAGDARFAVVGPFVLLPGTLDLEFESGFVLSGEAVGALSTTFKALESALKKKTKSIFGVEVTGAITFDLSFPEGGSAKLGIKLKLPTGMFSNAPDQKGKTAKERARTAVSFELLIKASNNFGIGIAGKTQIDTLWLGGLELKDASVAFDSGQKLLELGASVAVGPPSKVKAAPEVRAEIAFGPGGDVQVAGVGLRKFALSASKLNRPLSHGFFLQKLSVEVRRDEATINAVRFTGQGTLSFGPEAAVRGRTLAGFLGEVEVKVPFATETAPAKPWEIQLLGAGTILEVPMSFVLLKYTQGQGAKLTGNVDLTIAGIGNFAEIKDSWFSGDPLDFNLEAQSRLLFPGISEIAGQQAVISGTGHAVCFGPLGARIGIGRRWDTARPTVFGGTCDLAPFRSKAPRAAQAGAPVKLQAERGQKLLAIRALGADAPPKIAVTGPGGFSVATPADAAGINKGKTLLFQDPVANATHIVIRDPAPGTYTVAPIAGGVTPVSVTSATQRPAADVHAKVTGRGTKRQLTWRLRPQAGQTVAFYELAAEAARLIKTTRTSGRARFTPDLSLGGGKRTIEARVVQDGLPRSTHTVARYTVDARLRKVKGLTRTRRGVLRWRSQPAAHRYSVAVTDTAGTTAKITTTTRLRLPAAQRRSALTVRIVPIDALGRGGPATNVKIKAIKRKPTRRPRRR